MSLKMLEAITDDLLSQYPESQAWKNSKFSWIRPLPPRSKGTIGKSIASGMLNQYGFTPMAQGDILRVNGQVILPRMAMRWEGGLIKFQNIRNIKFDHALCFAIYPKDAYAWLIPKTEIWLKGAVRTDRPGIRSQHAGADCWVSIDPANPKDWLKPYGGTIEQAMAVAKTAL